MTIPYSPSIVIIDDDSDDLEVLSSALELHGFEAKCFEDAELACQSLSSIRTFPELPSLIIVDYNMPRINGEQVLSLLKSRPMLKHIPVVIYSTTISPDSSARLIALGACATISKAINYKELKSQVERFEMLATTLRIVSNPVGSSIFLRASLFAPPLRRVRSLISFALTLKEVCKKEFLPNPPSIVASPRLLFNNPLF